MKKKSEIIEVISEVEKRWGGCKKHMKKKKKSEITTETEKNNIHICIKK